MKKSQASRETFHMHQKIKHLGRNFEGNANSIDWCFLHLHPTPTQFGNANSIDLNDIKLI
mgnify:CR=1 FL=1